MASSRAHSLELTPRESEIAVLVANGLLNTEIRDRLGISRRTVETHLASICGRLGVRNRQQIAYAVGVILTLAAAQANG